MEEKFFNQTHDGYWRECNKGGLPKKPGIFFVYECNYDPTDDKILLYQLLYVGKSDDVNSCVATHEKTDDWKKHIEPGNVLCFSYTPVDDKYIERVDAAYVRHHQPVENKEYGEDFPFEKTYVKTSGENKLIDSTFIVG